MFWEQEDFQRLKNRALEIKQEAEKCGGIFKGGKIKHHHGFFGLLKLHINEHGSLIYVELPNGALIIPPK